MQTKKMCINLSMCEFRKVNAFGKETISSVFVLALNTLLARTEFLQ